jgi:hypothetical protein
MVELAKQNDGDFWPCLLAGDEKESQPAPEGRGGGGG